MHKLSLSLSLSFSLAVCDAKYAENEILNPHARSLLLFSPVILASRLFSFNELRSLMPLNAASNFEYDEKILISSEVSRYELQSKYFRSISCVIFYRSKTASDNKQRTYVVVGFIGIYEKVLAAAFYVFNVTRNIFISDKIKKKKDYTYEEFLREKRRSLHFGSVYVEETRYGEQHAIVKLPQWKSSFICLL